MGKVNSGVSRMKQEGTLQLANREEFFERLLREGRYTKQEKGVL